MKILNENFYVNPEHVCQALLELIDGHFTSKPLASLQMICEPDSASKHLASLELIDGPG